MQFKRLVDKVVDSPDCEPRKYQWVGILIHHTGIGDKIPSQVDESLWRKLQDSISGWLSKKDDVYVSAHFQIGRFGEIYQLVNPETHAAWHAGQSSWFHPVKREVVSGLNKYFIGIELLGDGNKDIYSVEQYKSLAELIKALQVDFPEISDPRCITGHENVSPGRKQDPGKWFDWDRLFRLIYAA